MKINTIRQVKTRKGKKFLESRAPKLIENDKISFVARGSKVSPVVTKVLNELIALKKPMVHQLKLLFVLLLWYYKCLF